MVTSPQKGRDDGTEIDEKRFLSETLSYLLDCMTSISSFRF